jgi:hypothetical protein
MFNNVQQNLLQRVSSSTDNRHLLSLDAKVGLKDTYITNKTSNTVSKIFDSVAQKFIDIADIDLTQQEIDSLDPQNPYSGGLGKNLLYREREYIKIGKDGSGTEFRGVVVSNPKNEIKDYLDAYVGNTAEKQYKIGLSTLSMSVVTGSASNGSELYATMLPLDSSVDETTTWKSPSETRPLLWNNEGGDTEPLAADLKVKGVWDNATSPQKLTFDVTRFLDIWKSQGEKSNLGILVVGDGITKDKPIQFFSNQSTYVQIGGTPLTNCTFFTGTEAQITKTNGIRVLITPSGLTSSISFDDNTFESEREWNIFNSATVIGSTGSIISPDEEQGLVLGTKTYTVSEKKSGSRGPILVVSGLCLGSIQNYYTTAEFFTINTVNLGTGYVELASPSTESVIDINSLIANDVVRVEYPATVEQNNVRQLTVKFTRDEKTTLNRARIYFNESVVTEDRNGQTTNLFISTKQPILNIQVLF